MMWKITKAGKVLSLNQRFKNYVGIKTKEQEASADVFSSSVVYPAEYQLSKDAFATANRLMQPFEIKRRLKSADGTYRWFLTKGIPVYDTRGEFKFWCGACSDIDDSVVLSEEMSTLQEKLPVSLWKAKPSGELYYGNSSFMSYCGIDFGKKSTLLSDLCFSDDRAALEKSLQLSAQKKDPFELKLRLEAKNGIYKWFHVAGSPILDGNGELLNYYGICTVRVLLHLTIISL